MREGYDLATLRHIPCLGMDATDHDMDGVYFIATRPWVDRDAIDLFERTGDLAVLVTDPKVSGQHGKTRDVLTRPKTSTGYAGFSINVARRVDTANGHRSNQPAVNLRISAERDRE